MTSALPLFIALAGLTHVRTAVNYPQSNERFHRTLDHRAVSRPDDV